MAGEHPVIHDRFQLGMYMHPYGVRQQDVRSTYMVFKVPAEVSICFCACVLQFKSCASGESIIYFEAGAKREYGSAGRCLYSGEAQVD